MPESLAGDALVSDDNNRVWMSRRQAKELEAARQRLNRLRSLVAEQAEDEGLWCVAETACEAYVMQELRKLHAAIEED